MPDTPCVIMMCYMGHNNDRLEGLKIHLLGLKIYKQEDTLQLYTRRPQGLWGSSPHFVRNQSHKD